LLTVTRTAYLLLIAVAAAGCGTTKASTPANATGSRYVQTWSKNYDSTSCGDWAGRMTEAQRWTAGYELLKTDRGDFATIPSDALVDRFKAAIDAACVTAKSETLAAVAAGVYEPMAAYHS
jgi:hypothetical protein